MLEKIHDGLIDVLSDFEKTQGVVFSNYQKAYLANEILKMVRAAEHSVQRMRCTCRRNFEGAIIKVDPNCPLVQAAHR